MTDRNAVLTDYSLLTDHDIYLYKEGNHFRLYDKLGAHMVEKDGRAWDAVRRLGAQRRPCLRRRGLQSVESRRRIPSRPAGTTPGSGRGSSRTSARARSTSTTSSRITTSTPSTRATRSPSSGRCRPGRPRWSGISTTTGPTTPGSRNRPSTIRSTGRRASMKSTWVPGVGTRAIPPGCSATTRSPSPWPTTSRTWASRTWSSCR